MLNSMRRDEMDIYKDELETAMVRRAEQLAARQTAWQAIAGKQHLYRVARLKSTGEWIRIVGLRAIGVFVCEHVRTEYHGKNLMISNEPSDTGRSADYGAEELECYSI